MKVNEIFKSIDGEGIRQGFLCSFVRFYGCNLRCNYCDTRYACEGNSFTEMSPKEILQELNKLNVFNITLTGGEPLCQPEISDLVSLLVDNGYQVNIETNGSVDFSKIWSDSCRAKFGSKLFLTVDCKLPDSGMCRMMNIRCFSHLQSNDVLKFVVQSRDDLIFAESIINNLKINAQIYFSSVFGKIEPAEIVEFMKERKLNNVRLQLQIHKFIWEPTQRGV